MITSRESIRSVDMRYTAMIGTPWKLLMFLPLFVMAACTAVVPKELPMVVEIDWSKDFHFDTTVGSYGTGRESKLLLLTIDTDTHRRMVKAAHGITSSNPSEVPERNYDEFVTVLNEQFGLSRVADWPIPPVDIQCLIFELRGNQDLESTLTALADMPEVHKVQPVQMYSTLQTTYNDPYHPLQHSMDTMQISETHRLSLGRGATVAIIDTGFDTDNIEFTERVVLSRNYVDRDEAQFRNDVHGMAVAGIIAAAADNETGMVGIAPEVGLLPMKACWNSDTNGDRAQCNSITLLKALDDAIQADVDVINLSLAGPRDPLLELMVEKALEQGIIVVSADPVDDSAPFPAVVEGTISVSDRPVALSGGVIAPGNRVLSLHPTERYRFYDGSSFSAAHVSGVVALVRELVPDISATEVLSLLRATSDPVTGEVNACRAVSRVMNAETALCSNE